MYTLVTHNLDDSQSVDTTLDESQSVDTTVYQIVNHPS